MKKRNPAALPARQRRAGPMKDRRQPRGGAKNEERELLEESADELIERLLASYTPMPKHVADMLADGPEISGGVDADPDECDPTREPS